MSLNETDEEIILQYIKGDGNAFKKLIDRYASSLYNFTSRLVGKNEAPDIVQEIFIKTWKNIHRFNPLKASFKTWIFTIGRNTATDFLRKKKNLLFSDLESYDDEGTTEFSENIADENLLQDINLKRVEDSQFLNNMLEKLNHNYRDVLVLHYQEEMTFAEIGEILGKSLNTVKSQHRRAIAELRKMIK
ncbi:MAG TPA: sigma-70 family RNA polymerase sigma factor [Candidatus Paceibacterota bacterium]|nr:sigma-70 family RNA polymerase sigma factor [Candidatus Paceibacterota bacterium]